MGTRQIYKGNPEEKRFYLADNFVGGVNNIDADDIVTDKSFRTLLNMRDDNLGVLKNRQGIKPYVLFNNLLERALGRKIPEYTTYIKVIDDNDRLLEYYFSQYEDMEKIVTDSQGKQLIILLAYDEVIKSVKYGFIDVLTIEGKNGDLFVSSQKKAIPNNKSAIGVETMEIGKKILLRFKEQIMGTLEINGSGTPVYKWYEILKNTGDNLCYKPTPLEIRKIGFNVLAQNPLTFINKQGIIEKSIQGMYMTDSNNVPVLTLPLNNVFKMYIMYTGSISDFDIKFKDGENELSANITKNTSDSTEGLKVYDVVFKDISSNEVEIEVSITGDTSVGKYRDYYPVGSEDTNRQGKAVVGLDISEYKSIAHFNRTLYYNDRELWFSEFNMFDYIPNYNYVIPDLEYNDEIISITFFKQNSYLIWTKNRIYKMTGAFGSADFTIGLVSDYTGCDNANTIRYVENSMVFLSQFGLHRLTSDKFSADHENVIKIDKKLNLNLKHNDIKASFLYDNKYILFYDNEALVYRYETDSFMFDKYMIELKMFFISNGKIYILNDGDILQFDSDNYYRDGDKIVTSEIKTIPNNLQYPMHDKKIKNIFLKCQHGSKIVPVYVDVIINGHLLYGFTKFLASINSSEEVIYETIEEPSNILQPNEIILGENHLDENVLGGTDFTVHKFMFSANKCKNIELRIRVNADSHFSLYSIGYLYKLKKVKGSS